MLSRLLYWAFVRPTVVAAVNLFWIRELKGIENIPKNGPAILVANHASYLDFLVIPSIISAKIGRLTTILAAKELTKHRVLGIFAGNDDCILIDRKSLNSQIETKFYKDSLKALKQGKLLLLFPEGTRSLDGKVQPWKPGFVRLASRAGVPIVPIAVKGTFDMLPKGGRFVKFGRKIKVHILKPVNLHKEFGGPLSKVKAKDVSDSIREKVVLSLQK